MVGSTGGRVVLVGYGSAGRGIHAPLLVAAGASPSIVVTADPERVAQVHADLPDAVVVPRLEVALELGPERGPDLAVLASPSGVHEANALACVAAGVPVVVDKPLATDAACAARVVAAARSAGVPLTVFQNRRWDGENLTLARLLAQGSLGEVHRFERRWERWRPVPRTRWRETASAAQGGGILLDLGPHLIDSAVRFFGPVTSVYAEIESRTTPAEDDVFLALQHASGVRSHLSASSLAGAPGPRTRVLGSRAAYVVTQFEAELGVFGFEDAAGCTGWLVAGPERSPVLTAPGGHGDFYPAVLAALARARAGDSAQVDDADDAAHVGDAAHADDSDDAAHVADAADAVARQASMPVDPMDAVHGLAVIDAARISAAQRRVVPLHLESGVTP